MTHAYDTLLYTKLSAPVNRTSLVTRQRLIDRLHQALLYPFTLICAPAGAGKTTAMTCWLESPQTAGLPVAWLSLEDDDNDPIRFTNYAAAALETLQPGVVESTAPLAILPQVPAPRALATALINPMHKMGEDFILVLDDYHCIENTDIHALVTFLIERMPSHMHLVVTSREDPLLPLARLRARSMMLEIREAELRFTHDEAALLLREAFGLPVSDSHIAALDARLEGWATGLKLAALAMRGRSDIDSFVQAFSGSHRYVIDYLMEEVFERQPDDIRAFLIDTAFLREMSGDLCNAVLEREDSQTLLERLVRLNLFTISLDDDNHWFRYHHLFADVLKNRQRRTSGAPATTLYRRAAAWYAGQRQYQAAMHYLLEAEAFRDAAQLVAEHGPDLIEREGYETPLRWISQIPVDALAAYPEVMLIAVLAYIKTDRSRSVEVNRLLGQAQASVALLSGSTAQTIQAKIDILKGILAQELENDLEKSQLLMESAMPYVISDTVWYCTAGIQNAWVYLIRGEIDTAVKLAGDVASTSEQHGMFTPTMEAYKVAGIALQHAGRYGDAVRLLDAATQKATSRGQMHDVELANVYFNLSRIALVRGDLALAQRACEQTLAAGEFSGVMALIIPSWLQLAELQYYVGDMESARHNLERAQNALDENPEIDLKVEKSTAALVASQIGDFQSAHRWLFSTGFNLRPAAAELPSYFEQAGYLLFHIQLVHVLINDLQHNMPTISTWESALVWAEAIYEEAVRRKTVLWQIRALTLMTVARQACGHREGAYAALNEALLLAQPEYLVYPFIVCGAPMRNLLRKFQGTGSAPVFVGQILRQFDALDTPSAAPIPQSSFEPLTEREREVLALVADGYSNSEIAHRLYLSVGTVKRHIANVFIKLGAESRTHALAIAREHGLI